MKTKLSLLIAVLILLTALTSCGTSSSPSPSASGSTPPVINDKTPEPAPIVDEMEDTTINIRVMNEYKNLDKVIAQYQEMTKDDPIMSKVHLNFSFVLGGEYKDKLTMALSAQEDYDLMFCGSWHGLSTFIQDGSLADLSGYFNNDSFPGLKAAFPENVVDAMTSYIRQADGNYLKGIFGVNLATFYEDSRGFIYREDLRKKYSLPEINSEDSLFNYVKTVSENEPDMLGMSLWNFFRMGSPWYSGKHENLFVQDNVNIFGDQTWVYVGLSDDHKTVLNAVVAGDSQEQFDKMPTGYQYDFITEYIVDRTKWNPYLSPTRGTTDTGAQQDAIISYSPLSGYESTVTTALTVLPDAEFGFYILEDAQRNQVKGAVVSDMVTNNWLVVPEWSEKKDATMIFLNWMFGSKENNDLFTYGIIGEEWEPIGEDAYKTLDIAEDQKYIMPTYSFTQNPNYIRYSQFVLDDPKLKSAFDYMYDMDTYALSPLSGFSFSPVGLESQLANVTALSNELQLIISLYDAEEAQAKINNWHTEAEKVGLNEIREALIAQIQAFLDAKNAG